MSQKKRIIKVQDKWSKSSGSLPELRFGGLWLEQMGFSKGQKVEIFPFGNKLIIKPVLEINGNQ